MNDPSHINMMRTETASKVAMVLILTSFLFIQIGYGSYGTVVDSGSKAAAASINKPVAVQGVVYCMHCKNIGFEAIFATLLPGAGVKLECSNPKLKIVTNTDKKGSFLIKAPESISTKNAGSKCKVSITKSPDKSCTVPMDYNGGRAGANLVLDQNSTAKTLPYVLYNVGPLAFEPKKFFICP